MGGTDRKLNFVIFIVWSALIAGVWVVAWSRKYCLGPAEIVSFVCLILFKDGGTGWGTQGESKISSFHVNQWNEEAG